MAVIVVVVVFVVEMKESCAGVRVHTKVEDEQLEAHF